MPNLRRLMQSAEIGLRIEQALAQLPDRQRAVINLFALEQIPQKQVAQTVGCSVEAVKWHVFRRPQKTQRDPQRLSLTIWPGSRFNA